MSKIIPILRIFDLAKAKEFYIDWLGFKIDWEHRFHDNAPIYLQVSRGDIVFHLSEHHGDGTPGSKVYVITEGLQEYHKELQSKKYKYNNPGISKTAWNTLCVNVCDPFGNKIDFNEELK